MSKLLWAGMAGFLCGLKYQEIGRRVNWKKMKRQAKMMLKNI